MMNIGLASARNVKGGYVVCICVASFALKLSALAQSVSDYAVRVSATVETNPPAITLGWPGDPNATGYTLYRKTRDAVSWGTGTPVAASATNYVDSNVTNGGAYEYFISKSAASYDGEGYLYAGIQAPLVEVRGKVVFLVDSSQATGLANELARLQQDLAGDGWTVLRHDVARMAVDPANTSSNVWGARSKELASVKAVIKSDFNADPANVQAVLLFGRIPVPYSGALAPDEHADHTGAWPADGYYGDMSGTWSDSSLTYALASDPRNWNVIGDGKFDQTALPANLALEVGRVDFANLPVFPQSETELLRQYLNKDHNFRHKLTTAERRGLIDDNFGLSTGEPLAVNGWRNFAPFFGANNTVAADWLTTLSTQSYLWGYGCGAGTYTSASGVASTTDFVTSDPRVVFTMFFGSYFGDWDSQDNFLRAALGTPTYTLTSAWAGRPNWIFHHMGLGETVGFGTRLTQNNKGSTYSGGSFVGYVHIALMGDPTLRMHIVAPPSALVVTTNGSGGVDLGWDASPDAVLGYHVYRAPTAAGPFTRLTTNLLGGTSYTDPAVSTNVYMVRAVKLEVSGSGSYYNASQGIFQSPDGSAGAPTIVLLQPANNAVFLAPTNIQLSANTFDPANGITNVAYYANDVKIGDAGVLPPYSVTWSNAPGGSYSLTARAMGAGGWVTNSSAVNVRVIGTSPDLVISVLSNGTYTIGGDSPPGRANRIQFLEDLEITNWQTLGTATANASGVFQFIDTNGVPQRFYRSVYP